MMVRRERRTPANRVAIDVFVSDVVVLKARGRDRLKRDGDAKEVNAS